MNEEQERMLTAWNDPPVSQAEEIAEARLWAAEQKHTPGPWKYDPIYDDGSMLRQRLLPARIIAGSEQVVAVFTMDGVPSYADARLIAAAPDMLEALKFISNYYNDSKPMFMLASDAYEMASVARAAIAKAKGVEL